MPYLCATLVGVIRPSKNAKDLLRLWFVIFLFTDAVIAASTMKPAFLPLQKYEGTWQVTRHLENLQQPKSEKLVNRCNPMGTYFVCEQSVNSRDTALLVFIPSGQPGHYHTQSILPEGRATGLDDLQISGDRWIFTSRRQLGGNITFYRNTNTFTDKNHIHFENAQSPNGKKWTTQESGEEVRISR